MPDLGSMVLPVLVLLELLNMAPLPMMSTSNRAIVDIFLKPVGRLGCGIVARRQSVMYRELFACSVF